MRDWLFSSSSVQVKYKNTECIQVPQRSPAKTKEKLALKLPDSHSLPPPCNAACSLYCRKGKGEDQDRVKHDENTEFIQAPCSPAKTTKKILSCPPTLLT